MRRRVVLAGNMPTRPAIISLFSWSRRAIVGEQPVRDYSDFSRPEGPSSRRESWRLFDGGRNGGGQFSLSSRLHQLPAGKSSARVRPGTPP